jgi:hypothetical protein
MNQKFPLPRIRTKWVKYFPNEGYFFPDGDFSIIFDFILSGIFNGNRDSLANETFNFKFNPFRVGKTRNMNAIIPHIGMWG